MFLARVLTASVDLGSAFAAFGGWVYATASVMLHPHVELLPIACIVAFGLAGGAALGFFACSAGRERSDRGDIRFD